MSRRKSTSVKVTFNAREGSDPVSFLRAIEAELKPRELDIEVNYISPGEGKTGEEERNEPTKSVKDEVLETDVRKGVEKTLDQQDRDIKEGKKVVAVSPEAVEKAKKTVLGKLKDAFGIGWKVYVTELAKRIIGG